MVIGQAALLFVAGFVLAGILGWGHALVWICFGVTLYSIIFWGMLNSREDETTQQAEWPSSQKRVAGTMLTASATMLFVVIMVASIVESTTVVASADAPPPVASQLSGGDESEPTMLDPGMVIQEVELDPTDIYMYVLPDGSQVVSVCLNGTRAFVVHDMQDDPSGIAVQEAQSC